MIGPQNYSLTYGLRMSPLFRETVLYMGTLFYTFHLSWKTNLKGSNNGDDAFFICLKTEFICLDFETISALWMCKLLDRVFSHFWTIFLPFFQLGYIDDIVDLWKIIKYYRILSYSFLMKKPRDKMKEWKYILAALYFTCIVWWW